MTLSYRDALILRRAGFTKQEVVELNSAVDPSGNPQPPIDLQSSAWLSALANRRHWTDLVRNEYAVTHNRWLSDRVYERIVDQWYAKGRKRTAWAWLKATYLPKKQIDFAIAARHRAQQSIHMLRREFRK